MNKKLLSIPPHKLLAMDLNSSWELKFLSKLVSFETDSQKKTNYLECAEFIKREAEDAGFAARIHDAQRFAEDGKPRPNVVVDMEAGAKQTLLLVTHYDVVPAGAGWRRPPFTLTIENGKAYGRGANDDKAAIAACLSAMRDLRRLAESRVNVRLFATCDEEVGGDLGAGFLVGRMRIRGNAALIIDGSPRVITGASGVVHGKIIIKGKQGHAGYPHKAKNAITYALPFLQEMEKFHKIREKKRSILKAAPGNPHPNIWGRFTLTMLRAGEKENIVPGECEARFDLRLLPEEDPSTAIHELKEYLTKTKLRHKVDAHLEITHASRGYLTPLDSQFVKNFRKVVAGEPIGMLGGNDGRHFAAHGIPTISFGTGRPECNIHGKNEFVYLEDMELLKHVIYNICANWEDF